MEKLSKMRSFFLDSPLKCSFSQSSFTQRTAQFFFWQPSELFLFPVVFHTENCAVFSSQPSEMSLFPIVFHTENCAVHSGNLTTLFFFKNCVHLISCYPSSTFHLVLPILNLWSRVTHPLHLISCYPSSTFDLVLPILYTMLPNWSSTHVPYIQMHHTSHHSLSRVRLSFKRSGGVYTRHYRGIGNQWSFGNVGIGNIPEVANYIQSVRLYAHRR
jgi:hypothetical protein